MLACPTCGKLSDDDARFCPACGTPLEAPVKADERKTVTVVFCDLVGSTSMGERLDSESASRVMGRYYTTLRRAIARHGGTVEKFIGDAVMAVFGVPTVHEDDAVRAVRAVADIQAELSDMNRELGERWGTQLTTRIGVNTGEVVTGDPLRGEPPVVGDAVNVAARLEQSAPEDGVLLGAETFRLVRGAVTATAVDPLELKGKSEPVPAFRLLDVMPQERGIARREDSPLVGRADELAELRDAFDRAVSVGRGDVLTLLGDAGVGKTRLVSDFTAGLQGGARVLKGRCLPYGDGITFWPLAEIVRQLGDALAALLPDDAEAPAVVERLGAALGFSPGPSTPEETFWATRRLFAGMARAEPLVVVFDDVHWGEPVFLDLLEDLRSRPLEGPSLVLVLARPELRETRPALAARVLAVRPLEEDESERLVSELLDATAIPESLSRRVVETAQGNPLFVEELLRMIDDVGDLSEISMPPTIQALLAARLDRLGPERRGVIQAAAVVGQEFWRGAIEALAPAPVRDELDVHLDGLAGRELIHRTESSVAGEEAFRFGHILIRDAAYAGLLKEARAELHERFADWLERKAGERIAEYEEILGYHLEQAVLYRGELAPLDERGRALGRRAAERLGAAGERAFGRGDMPAAANLLERAVALLDAGEPARRRLQLGLGLALCELGEIARGQDVLGEAAAAAADAGDRGLEMRAVLERSYWQLATSREGSVADLHRVTEEAIAVLNRAGDDVGLARAFGHLGLVHSAACRWTSAAEAYERGLEHARRASDSQAEGELLFWLTGPLQYGPTPVAEGIRRLKEISETKLDLGARALVEAAGLAGLEAMNGNLDEARVLCRRASSFLEELGQTLKLAVVRQVTGWVELLAGDADAAARELRLSFDALREMGESGYLSTTAALLAEASYARGEYADAERFAQVAAESAASDDIVSQVLSRATRGKLRVRQGDRAHGEALVREALALARTTDDPNLQADKLVDLAGVVGDGAEQRSLLRGALELYEAKGNVVSAGRTRALLELDATPPAGV